MGILLVYDVTNPKSFSNVANWLRIIQENSNPNVEKIILGNKCDMWEKRKVSKERAEAIAREDGIKFMETSAKTNVNIEEAFLQISECILDKNIDTKKHSTQTVPLTGTPGESSWSCCRN